MIKAQSLTTRFSFYWPSDPGVDTSAEGYSAEEYRRTLDAKYLPKREGAVLTAFECEPLNRRQYQRVASLMGTDVQAACVEACAYGLRAVKDFDAAGPLEVKLTTDQAGVGGQRVAPESLDRLFTGGGLELLTELGVTIMQRSKPGPL